MKFEETVIKLFELSEDLRSTRDRLVSLAKAINDPERLYLVGSVKEIDIVRATLLGQYELLDTSRIVKPEYLAAYYTRRLEILEMTRRQLSVHVEEIVAIGRATQAAEVLKEIERASNQVRWSMDSLDAVIGILKDRTMGEGSDRTLH